MLLAKPITDSFAGIPPALTTSVLLALLRGEKVVVVLPAGDYFADFYRQQGYEVVHPAPEPATIEVR